MNEFTSTARKDGRWWVVQCDQEPGALSQVARLDQAAEHQREAIAFVTGLDENEIAVEIRAEVDEDVRDLLDLADLHRYESERLAREAHRDVRTAVTKLVEQGYSLRDIGVILGVSHQRAHQLVQEVAPGRGDESGSPARATKAAARKAPARKTAARKAPVRRPRARA